MGSAAVNRIWEAIKDLEFPLILLAIFGVAFMHIQPAPGGCREGGTIP